MSAFWVGGCVFRKGVEGIECFVVGTECTIEFLQFVSGVFCGCVMERWITGSGEGRTPHAPEMEGGLTFV